MMYYSNTVYLCWHYLTDAVRWGGKGRCHLLCVSGCFVASVCLLSIWCLSGEGHKENTGWFLERTRTCWSLLLSLLSVCSCFLFSSNVRVDVGIIPLCVFGSRKRFVHYSHSYFRRHQSKWWETMAKGTSVAKACKSNLVWDRRVALSSLYSRFAMREGGDWWWSQPYCTFISDAVL